MKFAEAQARAGLTDRELSEKAKGVSTRTIWRIKNPDDEVAPRPSTMRRLAEALDVAVEDIEEFEEVIWQRTMKQAGKEGAPEDVLDMADSEKALFSYRSPDMDFIETMALRSVRESVEFLVRRGRGEELDKVYRRARGQQREDA